MLYFWGVEGVNGVRAIMKYANGRFVTRQLYLMLLPVPFIFNKI